MLPHSYAISIANIMAKMAAPEMEDTVELDKERRLFLKSIARMVILVQLPELKIPGSSISNWEVMEKLKGAICPNVYSYLKVTKTTMEYLQFEAEADSKDLLSKFISHLDGKAIKLSGFPEPFKVKAGKAKVVFPKKHDWVAFFRDSKNMDESKPGERPDTMHIKGLPIKWFSLSGKTHEKPCEKVIWDILEQFGPLRTVDIPILDPYRSRMNLSQTTNEQVFKTFSFGTNLYFEIFVQFMDYRGFERAMQVFKGRKLIHLLEDNKTAAVNIEVDFDRTGFLSENNIEKRRQQRQKLINYDLEQEEIAKQIRQQEELQKEIERLADLRREQEKQRQIEEEKLIREHERKIREHKRKLNKIRKKIIYQEKKRQAKVNERKKNVIISLRKKQADNLAAAILKALSDNKKIEQKEKARRAKELKILHQLESKKLKKEEEKRKKLQAEDEKRERLENEEKNLRLKLLNNLKELEESTEEVQRELLREKVASNRSKIVSVVYKNVNDSKE